MGLIQDYLTTVRGSWADGIPRPYTNIAKLEVLDINENVTSEITTDILEGSVNIVSQTGSRRTASVTLKNKALVYNLDPDGIWLDTKFRLWSGVEDYLGNQYYFSQGIFVLGECYEESQPSSATVRLELYDKACLLNGTISGGILYSSIIPINTNVVDAVKLILNAANTSQPMLNYTNKPLIADTSTFVMPYTLQVEASGTYMDILTKLSDAATCVFYFDRDGYPNFVAPVNYTTAPSNLVLTENDQIKIGFSKQVDIQAVKNSVVVMGGSFGDGAIYTASAQDTTPTDPTRIGRIGERQLYIEDQVIYTTALAKLRADYELSKAVQASEAINSTLVPIDFLDVDEIVTLTDARLKESSTRLLTKQITLPIIHIGNDMTVDIWRTRSFS